ncbi:MAG: septum formation protein Maf [Bacteroidetes bacterium]|nr:septum formation protein Maf [Bacteroidota bacterium]
METVLILASKSPRRKQLLEMAEIDFEIITEETDETFSADLSIEEVPIQIALRKAKAIQSRFPQRKILAADTVVVLDSLIIGKPHDRAQAIQILSMLSGRRHKVITGVVILESDKEIKFADTTFVEFNELSLADIIFYVDTYKPYDKAGAYAIQEWIGAVAIQRIEGCFYNVMGLPISRVVKCLH